MGKRPLFTVASCRAILLLLLVPPGLTDENSTDFILISYLQILLLASNKVWSQPYMSVGTPTAYLLWATLGCLFFGFMIYHLYSYDRFNCLRWNAGRQPGAFKRVMTYSYLVTLPLFLVFAIAYTSLLFREGYFISIDGHIILRAMEVWQPVHKRLVLPLFFVFSAGWATELVTHLEELTFWLFLLNQGPGKRNWFHSWEFRTWYMGTLISVIGMPLTTLVTRRDLDTMQAWIFLVGSSAGTATNLCFLYVLARFPGFLRHVKQEGAEPDVVVRLATFYQLNLIRVCFRFLFTVPLLLMAIDGVQGAHVIISSIFLSDFLLMIAGIGCFTSSAITLLIFFPRSITKESGYKAKNPSLASRASQKSPPPPPPRLLTSSGAYYDQYPSPKSDTDMDEHTPTFGGFRYPAYEEDDAPEEASPEYEPRAGHAQHVSMPDMAARVQRETVWARGDGHAHAHALGYGYASLGAGGGAGDDGGASVWAHSRRALLARTNSYPPVSVLHPYVLDFTSPIDLPEHDTYRHRV